MSYVSDKLHNFNPQSHNLKAADEGGDINFHNGNLFDQNEDAAGDLYDLATGKRIDNSTDTGLGSLAVREVRRNSKSEDMLGDLPKSKEDALTDQWLSQHDPNWSK